MSVTNSLELRRATADARLFGVCAGLARSWNVDPTLVRVGFVILTLFSNGLVFALYLATALVLPTDVSDEPPIHRMFPATRTWSTPKIIGVVAAVTAIVALTTQGMAPGLLFVMAITGAVIAWGRRHHRRRGVPARVGALGPAPSPTASEFERLAYAWQSRQYAVYTGAPLDVVEPAAAPVDDPGRNRPWLFALVGMGIVGVTAAALDAAGVAVPAGAWPAAMLGVLGLTLVWVARPGRPSRRRPTLMVTATVLCALATAFSMSDAPRVPAHLPTIAVSDVTAYADVTSLPREIKADVGSPHLDLTDMEITDNRTVNVSVDFGGVEIDAPKQGNIIVRYTVDAGSATVLGTDREGANLSDTVERITDPAAPTLTLDVHVGFGDVEVKSR